MVDFYTIKTKASKNNTLEIYPDFQVCRSKDLMTRGKSFYAIWNEEAGLWSTDEYDVQTLVDRDLLAQREVLASKTDNSVIAKLMGDFSTNTWSTFRNYLMHISDNAHQLDMSLTFANTPISKKDYVSKRLPYALEAGSIEAYEELVSTLYLPEERAKLEWAIGAILAGDGKDIQKFLVLYGEAGAGKSTMLNIIQKLFDGYFTTFEAKALTSSNNAFSTEAFKDNPLVAIQHDGDLSKIEDNSKLNSIVSHEYMTMNEKYKPSYMARANCFLFMATNKPVKITDAKSGIIRRLIDVTTSGKKLPTKRYISLVAQVDFELGAIAHHCLTTYREMGKNYYSTYRPIGMMYRTDAMYNFVEDNALLFEAQGGVSLAQAYELYKTYCDESEIGFKLARYKFRDELRNYFSEFSDIARVDGKQIRSYFSGFLSSKFDEGKPETKEETANSLVLDHSESLLDVMCAGYLAQYATPEGTPSARWATVKTILSNLDTTKLHYVRMPANHIVIDFDIRDDAGQKSAQANLEAASLWPPTYAEYSKSGAGIHLHYIYVGDPEKLSGVYAEGIEVKVPRGDAALRRQLSKCNNIPVADLAGGLPLKGEKVINFGIVKSERGLIRLVERNLAKEIHPGTKPSIDFIKTILDEAYASGMQYDLTTLRQKVLIFANNSTNHSSDCVKTVTKMHFRSEDPLMPVVSDGPYSKEDLVFFDVEVFPNLLVVCWKFAGASSCSHMINPEPNEIEDLFRMRLVGFNCRRYDNHILYARYLGYSVAEVYALSMKIVGNSANAYFREAYGVSYTDVYDFSSKKQSLKKFEIELGIHHNELGLPWDQPVAEDLWPLVVEYCDDDVIATEATFEARKEDFVARQMLAELSGLSVNDTTQMHTARIIFGSDPKPQEKFVYTDLSEEFPGYKFDYGKSSYRGEDPGEGGYVYAEPGMYNDVALLDVASMHPTSIEILDLFGPYTKNFSQIKAARLAIKHKNYDAARGMLGGIFSKYLVSEESSVSLSYALKIIINIVYGLTSAKFENKFKDPRNIDNIVAKRGALFMIDLKHAVVEQGFTVAHIKTDSIKIPGASKDIIDFVFSFGERYGYTFEHEANYDRFCLVNEAVYIARDKDKTWSATGAQFAHPFVFKTLFSHEPIEFEDLCETKSVTTEMVLDMNEGLGEDNHNYQFVGKVGSFCPILPGRGGGVLLRKKEDKYYAVTGTKNYRWLEAEVVKKMNKEDSIDYSYHQHLADAAKDNISKFGDFESFIS